jgi:quercetin dioxygenase-like cupin family protein
MEIRASGSIASRRAPADYFTGTVWQDPVVEMPAPGNVRASLVHFEPGARTAWHTHPAGQTLYILSGVGRVQSSGGPVREVHAGDVISFSPRREALARRRPSDHHVAHGDHRGERRQICDVDGKSSR